MGKFNKKKNLKPRVLFVCMRESIHSARWINQFSDFGWDLHVFAWNAQDWSSTDPNARLLPPLKNCTVHGFGQKEDLAQLITKLKPDLIHSLFIPGPGECVLQAKRQLSKTNLPPWIASDWGIDLPLYSNLSSRRRGITEVLSNCDYYIPECERDVPKARELGFKGKTLWIGSCAGGLDLNRHKKHWTKGRVSDRRFILVKGYENTYGRALVALKALELCADVLADYEIGVFGANEPVEVAVRLLQKNSSLRIKTLPAVPPEKHLKRMGKARVSLGLAICDGINTSVLEAMMMGAFPIQADTCCGEEWIVPGKTGFLVPAENPAQIAKALRKAVANDRLVESAAFKNLKTLAQRANLPMVKERLRTIYASVMSARVGA